MPAAPLGTRVAALGYPLLTEAQMALWRSIAAAAVTGGGALGTIGGGVVGGVIGHEVGERKDERK